jgi:hypothetical protein
MKKHYKKSLLAIAVLAMAIGFCGCSNDNNSDKNQTDQLSVGDQYLQHVLISYVDNTINPTYSSLAKESTDLYSSISDLLSASQKNAVTQEMVDNACKSWKNARSYYESSEAFLLGAASDYDIDPHIDTWPLDLSGFHSQLTNKSMVERLSGDDGDVVANGDLGQTLLGFHGIEFILFRDGQPRKASELNADGHDSWNRNGLDFTQLSGDYELTFAKAVAGDLRNSVYRLECCWNKDAPADHRQFIEDRLGWSTYMLSNNSMTYGENMKAAGQIGSLYRSVKNAVSAILVGDNGCGGISDEVGLTKITNPFSGKDPSYIESPYSYNSLTDFWDNIQSINNVWNGGVTGNRSDYSMAGYFKKYNSTIGNEVQNAIDDAQSKIKAIPTPFVLTFNAPANKTAIQAAIDACKNLTDVLNKADDFVQSNNK